MHQIARLGQRHKFNFLIRYNLRDLLKKILITDGRKKKIQHETVFYLQDKNILIRNFKMICLDAI